MLFCFLICLIFGEGEWDIAKNKAVYHSSAADNFHTGHLLTNYMSSSDNYWEPRSGPCWFYIDFGSKNSQIINVSLLCMENQMGRKVSVSGSNDTKNWGKIGESDADASAAEFSRILSATCRYLRFSITGGNRVRVKSVKVFGITDFKIIPSPIPPPDSQGRQYLNGGLWKLQRASEVAPGGKVISTEAFNAQDENWIQATVPGTILTSYLNIGAIPDPNYGAQQLQISDSFFTADFWYRDTFTVPGQHRENGERVWLNFNAVNWKAEVYFNGEKLGDIKGAFIRGRFDITDLVHYEDDEKGPDNYLAVLVRKPAHPGQIDTKTVDYAGGNGGVLARDSPVVMATVGWDWVMTVRGRSTGIYKEVYLSFTKDVVLLDPWVETHVNQQRDLGLLVLHAEVENVGDKPYKATIKGVLNPGNHQVSEEVILSGNRAKKSVHVKFNVSNPQLWYPNRYGDPYLYDFTCWVEVKNLSGDAVVANCSDKKQFKVGIREITYARSGTFKIYVNGLRIYCSGGNWGMDESMLRANSVEEYDIRVRLHKEAGFTMIRNWVGMTHDEYFYEACDRWGLLIEDDFWLANPSDGPEPDDQEMFRANAYDRVLWTRKHVSIGFYCGRNEGSPPYQLDQYLGTMTRELDTTPRFYVSDSAARSQGVALSGHGPYTVQGPDFYYNAGSPDFHTERGMPNVPMVESIRDMLSPEMQWPMSLEWGLHDFAMGSAQNGRAFLGQTRLYGLYGTLEEFVWRAQFVNEENHKALFEGPSLKHGNALLMWMSQSCWPSFVWQSYDFFFDTNAGYFGIKRGNQVINLVFHTAQKLWSVVNNGGIPQKNLNVKITTYDTLGKIQRNDTDTISVGVDDVVSGVTKFTLPPGKGVYFLQGQVFSDNRLISQNFYWINTNGRDFTSFRSLPNISTIAAYYTATTVPTPYTTYAPETYKLSVSIENNSTAVLLLVRLKVQRSSGARVGTRVLPVYYGDNYFGLVPGEKRTIPVEFGAKYLSQGEDYEVVIEGWNLNRKVIVKH